MALSDFSSLAYYFQTYGVMDFLLPFLLVFTIIFAVTQKVPLFNERKNFRVIISLVLALIFVVPHIMGTYPLGYDPVQVINETLPSISLVAVAAVMLLLLMGIFGTGFAAASAPIIAVVAIAFVVYIFGASLNLWNGPYDVFSWWTPKTTELIIILLVFGLIVYWITKEEGTHSGTDIIKKGWEGLSKLFQPR